MSTYDHKRVIQDYGNGKLTPAQATGHGLQHIDKLYKRCDHLTHSQAEQRERLAALEAKLDALLAHLAPKDSGE